MPPKIYEFNEFRLDPAQKTLQKNGEIVAIQPKVFDVLAVLVERGNTLVSREDLLREVWGETFVEETSIRLCIHSLRKIFDGRFIETVPKRGYRFSGEIKETEIAPPTKNDSPAVLPEKSLGVSRFRQNYKIFTIAACLIFLVAALSAMYFRENAPAEKMTIAVLPFAQIGEKTVQNLAVADAVIVQLSKLKDFKILPISSVQNYAERNFDALSTGRELRAGAVLFGSFQVEKDRTRVSASLQNTETGETVWSENFDVKPDEATGFETSIAARLARLFALEMIEYDDEKSAREQNVNSEARNAYLSARKIWRSRDLGRVEEASSLLNQSVRLEPDWAAAHSANAESLLMDDTIFTVYEKAEQVALKTLELDAQQIGAIIVLGQVALNKDSDIEKAETLFKKAIEINPNYASAYNEYGNLLAFKGNFAESERILKKALELEPFSPLYNTSLCQTYYFDKKSDAALKQCRFAQQLEPDFWLARKNLFWIYVFKKMNKEAAEMILTRFSDAEKERLPFVKPMLAGDFAEYWKYQLGGKSQMPNGYVNAVFYMQLGEREKALESLEQHFANKGRPSFTVNADPIFEQLKSDPRFVDILRKLKLSN